MNTKWALKKYPSMAFYAVAILKFSFKETRPTLTNFRDKIRGCPQFKFTMLGRWVVTNMRKIVNVNCERFFTKESTFESD